MATHFILIDFENVQPTSLGALVDGETRVRVFIGASQTRVPLELASALQALGSNAEYIQIIGNGSNALDFHIAYAIGHLSALHPDAHFTIVSRDTGFDPLIKYLARKHVVCKRVATLADCSSNAAAAKRPAKKAVSASNPPAIAVAPARTAVKPAAAPAAARPTSLDGQLGATVARLIKLKAARPRTLKTLTSSLKSWFTPILSDAAATALLDALSRDGKLRVDGNKVTYTL